MAGGERGDPDPARPRTGRWRPSTARSRCPRTIGGRTYLIVSATETTERVRLDGRVRAAACGGGQRRLELAETLAEVHRVIHSSLDYDEVMQRSLEEATRALGARGGRGVHRPRRRVRGAVRHRLPEGAPRPAFSAAIFPFSDVLERTREPVPIARARHGYAHEPHDREALPRPLAAGHPDRHPGAARRGHRPRIRPAARVRARRDGLRTGVRRIAVARARERGALSRGRSGWPTRCSEALLTLPEARRRDRRSRTRIAPPPRPCRSAATSTTCSSWSTRSSA